MTKRLTRKHDVVLLFSNKTRIVLTRDMLTNMLLAVSVSNDNVALQEMRKSILSQILATNLRSRLYGKSKR